MSLGRKHAKHLLFVDNNDYLTSNVHIWVDYCNQATHNTRKYSLLNKQYDIKF